MSSAKATRGADLRSLGHKVSTSYTITANVQNFSTLAGHGESVAVELYVLAERDGQPDGWDLRQRGDVLHRLLRPVLREGVDELERLIASSGVAGSPVIGLEATGSLHCAWAAEIDRRWPGSLRLFAPSETTAARIQLRSRRFKTDDRDCVALVWLLRQGAGRPAEPDVVAAMLGAVRHRANLSTPAGCSSSVCMTSSTRSARGCRPRPATGAR